MNAAVYPNLLTSRALKPSNTPGRTRISGASMRARRRLPGLALGVLFSIGVSLRHGAARRLYAPYALCVDVTSVCENTIALAASGLANHAHYDKALERGRHGRQR